MYKLYVSDMYPNGTQNVFIANKNKFVAQIDEACFGIPVNDKTHLIDHDGLEVYEVPFDAETAEYDTYLYEVTLDEVLKHVAVSPVSDGQELLDALVHYGIL